MTSNVRQEFVRTFPALRPEPLDLRVGQRFRTHQYVGVIQGVNKTVVVFKESRPFTQRMAKRATFEDNVREGMIKMIDPVETFDMDLEAF
jgi:hypothetical protein